jgi:RND family efflux transporter MFP subunit
MPDEAPPSPKPVSMKAVRRFAWGLLIVAVILGVWGIVSRVTARDRLGKETSSTAIPVVRTEQPSRSPATEDVTVPGTVQALIQAPIYARTSGYLRAWYTDIGTPVKKGMLLAEIDTPEVDQQYAQAKADLATAVANAKIADITNERWKALLATHSVSQQDADQREANAEAARAGAASAAANVARLRDLEAFKRVVAPFDGVVTQRNTDIGALINAGQNSGAALFQVADIHKLRVYVQVPEVYAGRSNPGVVADLHFNEHPQKTYVATVVRTASAIDPVVRTLEVELLVDNANGELFPGSYAEVHLKVPGSETTLRISSTALIFRGNDLEVATLDANQRVTLKTVVQGRDFGGSVEILSGLAADDRVVVNPPDSITNGAQMRIASPPPNARS